MLRTVFVLTVHVSFNGVVPRVIWKECSVAAVWMVGEQGVIGVCLVAEVDDCVTVVEGIDDVPAALGGAEEVYFDV